jgi:hypothetical protein
MGTSYFAWYSLPLGSGLYRHRSIISPLWALIGRSFFKDHINFWNFLLLFGFGAPASWLQGINLKRQAKIDKVKEKLRDV